MRPACLILLVCAALYAAQEVELKAARVAHVLVIQGAYLNGQGPFRMMLDTGATSCLVRPAVAKRLGLRPAYAVEHETVGGVNHVPVAILDDLRIGPVSDKGIETMITDVELSGVDGVLGQSWLLRHDYLLDYSASRLVLNAPEPGRGVRTALRSSDGRPMIEAEVDGRRQDLVVDSGASGLVLFGRSPMAGRATLVTNGGSVEVGTGRARITIGGTYTRMIPTIEVKASPLAGLLPAVAFSLVYISNRGGMVVMVP